MYPTEILMCTERTNKDDHCNVVYNIPQKTPKNLEANQITLSQCCKPNMLLQYNSFKLFQKNEVDLCVLA